MNLLKLEICLDIHFSMAFCCLQMVSMGRRRFGTDFQLMFRILKGLLFLGFVSVMTVLFAVFNLTIKDLFASILAFFPTGWAMLLVSIYNFFLIGSFILAFCVTYNTIAYMHTWEPTLLRRSNQRFPVVSWYSLWQIVQRFCPHPASLNFFLTGSFIHSFVLLIILLLTCTRYYGGQIKGSSG